MKIFRSCFNLLTCTQNYKAMRHILLMFAALTLSMHLAHGQKLIIGGRAPELKVKEWATTKPAESGPRLIEFFFSGSKPSVDRLTQVDAIAKTFNGRLTVIVITKEPKDKVMSILSPSSRSYFVAMDDNGRSFDAYGIQFVPFCVIIDNKGRIAWFGNSTSLCEEVVEKYL